MSDQRHHPKSVRLSIGFLHIGPKPRYRPALSKRIVADSFRKTLTIQPNRRIAKLRYKMGQGTLTDTDAIIGTLECLLALKPKREFVSDRGVARAA